MNRPELPEIEDLYPAEIRVPVDPEALGLRRAVANYLELWFDCRSAACRSACTCRSRDVACFDERRPAVAARMTRFLYEGYVDEDGEAP